jgi:hypothetical protein
MTGAAIGAAVAGIAGAGASVYESNKASDSFNNALGSLDQGMAQLGQNNEEQMAFAQGLMDDWEGTFGGIQENLSDYYSNLDPTKYATEYKTNLNDQIDKQVTQMNESFSAMGMQTSGNRMQMEKEAGFAKATGGAQADMMADDKVASMQQDFVNSGQGQFNAGANAMNSAFTNQQQGITGMYQAQSNLHGQEAGRKNSSAGGFLSGGLGLAGSILGNS